MATEVSSSQQQQAQPATSLALAATAFWYTPWKEWVWNNDSNEGARWLLYSAGHGKQRRNKCRASLVSVRICACRLKTSNSVIQPWVSMGLCSYVPLSFFSRNIQGICITVLLSILFNPQPLLSQRKEPSVPQVSSIDQLNKKTKHKKLLSWIEPLIWVFPLSSQQVFWKLKKQLITEIWNHLLNVVEVHQQIKQVWRARNYQRVLTD